MDGVEGEPGPRNLPRGPLAVMRVSVKLVLDFSAGHQGQVGELLGARSWSALCPAHKSLSVWIDLFTQ